MWILKKINKLNLTKVFLLLYNHYNNKGTKGCGFMILTIDFNSDEALYMQLRNQIIYGIANDEIKEGDSLPSVRQMADDIGINMHTVNKAYSVLKNEGFLKLDRRYGAIIAFSVDKLQAVEDMKDEMRVILAKAICKNVTEEEAIEIVHQIYDEFLT